MRGWARCCRAAMLASLLASRAHCNDRALLVGLEIVAPAAGACVWREFVAMAELLVDGLDDLVPADAELAHTALASCDVCFSLAARREMVDHRSVTESRVSGARNVRIAARRGDTRVTTTAAAAATSAASCAARRCRCSRLRR